MAEFTRLDVARSELILGGQKSGKSRRAEALAQSWLAQSETHRAVLIATAQAGDDEMRQRMRVTRPTGRDACPPWSPWRRLGNWRRRFRITVALRR